MNGKAVAGPVGRRVTTPCSLCGVRYKIRRVSSRARKTEVFRPKNVIVPNAFGLAGSIGIPDARLQDAKAKPLMSRSFRVTVEKSRSTAGDF